MVCRIFYHNDTIGAIVSFGIFKNSYFIRINIMNQEASIRQSLKTSGRIVVKIGSSSLTHPQTGALNLRKVEKLIRVLCDLKNEGKDIVL